MGCEGPAVEHEDENLQYETVRAVGCEFGCVPDVAANGQSWQLSW